MNKIYFKRNKFVLIVFVCLLCLICLLSLKEEMGFNHNNDNHQDCNINEIIRQNEDYYKNEQSSLDIAFNDLLEGYTGEGYNLEEEYYSSFSTRFIDSKKQCDNHCSSHGSGREVGGTALLNSGCRNYKGWSYDNYGSLSIPFWINMNSMNTIANDTHRNTLINDIRYQISLWNSTQMHDGTGTLIYLYEVGIGESSRPGNINGKKVVEILRQDGSYSGQFSPSDLQIRINYSDTSLRGGRNIDTPLHEMGHLLGLMDLEADGSGIARGTHKTLMGYNRGTTSSTIDDAIKYQDIQGVAVLNNIHTEHQYMRYVIQGDNYLNICFYCDRIDSTNSPKSSALPIQSENNCIHNYQQLVSCKQNHWLKCIKCYKVIESEFNIIGENDSGTCVLKILGPLNNNITSIEIPSQIGGQNVKIIGSEAFKGCASLSSVTIPNTVTNIDSSAFESCSYLQNVTLSNNLMSIGDSVFKGCTSLSNITIPNNVTNIDSNAFENCTTLSSITLSNNLQAIGTSAFKGCTNLSSVTLPKSVQYIDEEAFRNCSSLSIVNVLKETSPITNLGQNVFTGCDSNLEIKVPINRLIEYKNKEYWSSYRNKITSDGIFEEINIDCETTRTVNYNLQQGLNKCYRINVDCAKSYRTSVISNNDVSIKLYNENMMFVNENTNVLDEYLNVGTYYVLFEYENIELNGLINVDFSLRWPNNFTQISYNVDTNILSNLHNTAINTKHGKFCYLNNQGEGLYKITLNAGNITYPAESLMIYADSNRMHLLNRYNNPEETTYATSLENENVMFVYLPSSGYYYIDVVLPSNNYSSITLKIEKAEANNIDYTTSLSNICFDILFEGNSLFSNFEEVTISHRSKIQLDVVTSGSIFQNIKVVVLQKIKEPGYEPGDNHYYNVVKLEDYITTINKSPVFDIIFDSGTYYIGFINNSNHVSISMALRKLVNQEVDMNNTLVADPATNEGYTLGSEVTVNNGMCNSDTITEGFTRCIYLMVENRLRDPISRLEYDWYSSNENVAIVTTYGTVIAKSVNVDTIVTIYAVLKTDPSIVYRKTFTIVNDTKTYATDPLDYYLTMTVEVRENELINLSSLNVPIDMTQYYNWSGSPLLNINYWGYIYAEPTAQGMTFEVVGTYILNSRVKIHLTVYVN